jgi:hypothetical protein
MRLRTKLPVLTIAAALLLGLTGCPEPDGPSMIRIHNASSYDFEELQVGDHDFGPLPIDGYTEYRDFGTAYDYNYVSLTVAGDLFVLQPVDHVGEEPLGEGEFTYEIDIVDYDGRGLSIHSVAD